MTSGIHVEQPFFSDKDLEGKKVGDVLPDNEVCNRPLSYELLKLTPDMVYYCRRGTISEVKSKVYVWRWTKDEVPDYPVEEIANDMMNLSRIDFMKKYKDCERKHDFSIFHVSRKPITTKDNDVWRWLEGDGVFEAMQKAGFNIIKSKERGKVTYAALPSAKIIPVQAKDKSQPNPPSQPNKGNAI